MNAGAAAGAAGIWKLDWGGYVFTAEMFSALALIPAFASAALVPEIMPPRTAWQSTAVVSALLFPVAFFAGRILATAMVGV